LRGFRKPGETDTIRSGIYFTLQFLPTAVTIVRFIYLKQLIMKSSFTIKFLFHLLFLVLAVFLILFFQGVSGQTTAPKSSTPAAFSVSIAPNPVRSSMKVTASGVASNETLVIEIFRPSGKVVYRGSILITGPTTVKTIQRPTAASGFYYYRVTRKKSSQIVSGRILLQ
jgi:hypothetical protein